MEYVAVLTDRFERALIYATHVHGGQVRKGTYTPYVAHLLADTATVLELAAMRIWLLQHCCMTPSRIKVVNHA